MQRQWDIHRYAIDCGQVDSPAKMPDAELRRAVAEPYAALEMFAPTDYSGTLMELAQSRRGEYVDLRFLNDRRCAIRYNIPLAELITDFFDAMKSRSKGYASMEYAASGRVLVARTRGGAGRRSGPT